MKIWTYVSAFLAGLSFGIIVGAKYINGAGVEIKVRKIKNKKVSGTTSTVIPITVKHIKKKRKLFKRNRDER